MRITNEIKVGIVIMVALLIGLVLFAKTEKFKGGKTYELKTSFKYGGNIKPNAVVKLTGIEVGRVKEIDLIYSSETIIECVMELNMDAKVRTDSIAYIDTAGLVGDAYVGITAGKSGEFCTPGSILASEDPVQMRILMKRADGISKSLNEVLEEVKTIMASNKNNFEDIIVNIKAISENFEEFSKDIKEHPWKLLYKGD